jgi:uncharacterized protein DUF1592/uncharacterized protein DUF1588/uncharacterized protein DUF1595/uncharacterized protein DUF1587/uncharacterized protein DUF1585
MMEYRSQMRPRVLVGEASSREPESGAGVIQGRRRYIGLGLLALAAGSFACSNVIADNTLPGGGSNSEAVAPVLSDARPAPAGRFPRLTHTQWRNSVRDLIGVDLGADLERNFPADSRTAGFLFDNHELSLEVDQVLSSAYASAAEQLAERVTGNPAVLASLLPPASGSEAARARAFIESFGERTFRRPLEPAEVEAFFGLFTRGQTAYDDVAGFEAGIRLLLEAFLQSPHFLYRVEASTSPVDASIPLSDWELGQRLSYLLTNSTPDVELLAAARAGQLSSPSEVRNQALRLLSTAAARPALVGFHEQLLEFEKFDAISPSPSAYPGVSPRFADDVIKSSRMFIEDLVVAEAGTFKDLMTSTQAFVNAELASVYGVAGNFGANFVKVELPAAERRGIFNQIGFLAANSTSVNPDPIHRGVFIATRMLCIGIAAPPDGVPPLPPITDGTNRQVVANHTESSPVCSACHSTFINPLGFPFENYDATGAYRTTDNGLAVDASTSPLIDGQNVDIQNSLELAEKLGESRDAHECFVSHLVEYAFGRARGRVDASLIDGLTEASLAGTSIVELLIRIAESPAFMTRSTEELP